MAKTAAVLGMSKLQKEANNKLQVMHEEELQVRMIETQTEVILMVNQATQVEPEPIQLQELQPVPMETIADFGFDVDVADLCQLEGSDSLASILAPGDIPD